MPLPSAADQVVIQGVLLDEVTGAGLAGTVTSQPVALAGQSAEPMVLAADSHAHIQTRPRTATPDPTTGYWAIMALSTNDPDLDAYGGRTITLPGQAPRTIEVPWNAPQVTVSTAMAAQINPGNVAGRPVAGDTVRAIWYHQAAGFVAPTPANAFLTSAQTIDLIASAIGSGGGGGSGSGDLPEYSASAQTAAVTASGLTGKTTRFNTTSAAIAQPLPPAVAGRQVAVGWDAGTNALTLTADGSDVIGSGSATSIPIPVINAVVQLHCTTPGRWRVVGGHLPSSYVVFNNANTDQTGAAPGKVVAVSSVDGQGRPSYGLASPGAADPSVAVAAQRGRWPVMEISTTNAAPVVDKDNYVNAAYSITGTDGNALHSGTLRVKGRGNSTWELPKKPYRLNLDSSTALLGMTAVQKNWALLANHFDPAKLNNGLGLTLGQKMPGLTWTPQYRYVELILNGDFLGVYMLADLVRLESGRLPGTAANADSGDALTGTYLLEISNKERSGPDPGWNTSQGVWIIYDTPEAPTAAQTTYIQGFINDFETALYGANFADPTTGYAPFIDSTSFADWYLVNELMMNGDSWFWSSCKLHKTPTTGGTPGRLRMGPLWDFDLSMGLTSSTPIGPTGYRTRLNHPSGTGPNWYDRLFRDAAFVDLVRDRWVLLRDTVLPDIAPPAWIDRQVDRLDAAILRDGRRWTQTVYTPQQAHGRKRFLQQRTAWLDPLLTAPANPLAATVTDTV